MVLGIEVGKALVSTCKVVMVERLKDWVGLESCVYDCLCKDRLRRLDGVCASVPMSLLD
jgi:hypothetical protein